jgi:hypothetical protein
MLKVLEHILRWVTDRWLDLSTPRVDLETPHPEVQQIEAGSQLIEIADLEGIYYQDPIPDPFVTRVQERGPADAARKLPVLQIIGFVLALVALFVWLF